MGVIRFENTVQDPPVDIRRDPVKRNPEAFPDTTRGPIAPDHELSLDDFLLARPVIKHRRADGMIALLVATLGHINIKLSQRTAALDDDLVSQQITQVDTLDLALSDNVQAAITRVGLVRPVEEQLLAVLVDGCAFDQGTFLLDLGG